jgi:hypothetical protein
LARDSIDAEDKSAVIALRDVEGTDGTREETAAQRLSKDLEASVREIRVGPIDHQLSDHAPIVLDLAIAD